MEWDSTGRQRVTESEKIEAFVRTCLEDISPEDFDFFCKAVSRYIEDADIDFFQVEHELEGIIPDSRTSRYAVSFRPKFQPNMSESPYHSWVWTKLRKGLLSTAAR